MRQAVNGARMLAPWQNACEGHMVDELQNLGSMGLQPAAIK